ALVAQTDGTDITSLTLVSLGADDKGGGVLFIPVSTVTPDVVPDPNAPSSTTTSTTRKGASAPPVKQTTLAAAYVAKGDNALTQLTANVVGNSIDELITLTDDQVSQFVNPVAPLTIDNPDRLVDGSGANTNVVFGTGVLALQAADVPHYLDFRNADESD